MTFAQVVPWLLAVVALAAALALALRRRPGADAQRLEVEREQDLRRIGELEAALQEERTKKDELTGKGKQLYESYKNLEADAKVFSRERDGLQERIAKIEAEQGRREKEQREALEKLAAMKQSFDDEKMRVRREDEEQQQRAIAERDRLWNEHEQKVVARLKALCSQPEYAFRTFDNENLPEGFDGSFKPDFMVEFLGQYVIFDAKVSRSDNFSNYVRDQVQKTAKKVKGRADIYPTIFLVAPTDAIRELKETAYYEGGFTFYVISPEALPPILASLKKITTYEFAEQFNPEEREQIVRVLAKFQHHIHTRATFDVLLAKMAGEILGETQRLHPDLAEEVEHERQKMRLPSFKSPEVKKLMGGTEARREAVEKLTSPKAVISRREVEMTERMVLE